MKTTIATRIGICFIVTTLTTGAISYFAYNRLKSISALTSATRTDIGQIVDCSKTEILAHQMFGRALEHVMDTTDDEKNALDKELNDGKEAGDKTIVQLSDSEMDDAERKQLDDMIAKRKQWLAGMHHMIQLSHEHRAAEAMEVFHKEADPAFDLFADAAENLRSTNVQSSGSGGAEIISMSAATIRGLLLGIVVSLIIAVVVAQVILGINRLLRKLANSLTHGSEQVATAAQQVSGSSQSLAHGASEQAASLEETSSSLEEMSSSMTRKNADKRSARPATFCPLKPRQSPSEETLRWGRMSLGDRRNPEEPRRRPPRSLRRSTRSRSRPTCWR